MQQKFDYLLLKLNPEKIAEFINELQALNKVQKIYVNLTQDRVRKFKYRAECVNKMTTENFAAVHADADADEFLRPSDKSNKQRPAIIIVQQDVKIVENEKDYYIAESDSQLK
ncbi:MAG: hypothetical protein EZS28_027908 [Streblomastix strix]|uniref:Uncharacterized protein n=1 Tax=Streblomastix strix TaxID=222440 RepID=A0A5J4V0R2_9EUKA|nr:MAG: hypothetical protein EZS28_027908 [Streblomastix strix]